MWKSGLLVMGLLGGAAAATAAAGAGRRRRSRYRAIVQAWRAVDEATRPDVLRRFGGEPGRAAAWFLQGVDWLQQGRRSEAARAFGMAHHADWRLESAALLTFACLKSRSDGAAAFLACVSTTWHEMGRPAIGATTEEQVLLRGMAQRRPSPGGLSNLGRLVWLAGPQSVGELLERIAAGTAQEEDWACDFRAR